MVGAAGGPEGVCVRGRVCERERKSMCVHFKGSAPTDLSFNSATQQDSLSLSLSPSVSHTHKHTPRHTLA